MKRIQAFLQNRPFRLSHQGLKKLLGRSPVLLRGLALVPVAAACHSLRNALALSVVMAFVLLPTLLLLSLIRRSLWEPMRLPAAALVAFVFYIPGWQTAKALLPDISTRLGIFLPLLLVDTLLFCRAEESAYRETLGRTMCEGLLDLAGFVLVALLSGFVRELAGMGTLMGQPVHLPWTTSLAILPAGGFILLGFLAAGWRLCGEGIRRVYIRRSHRALIKRQRKGKEAEE